MVTQPRNLRLFCLCTLVTAAGWKEDSLRAGSSPNREETVETSFKGTAQIYLLCGFASAWIPKTLADGFGHYATNS